MEKEGITDSSFRRLASYFAVVGINEDMSMVNNDGPLDIPSLRFNSALQDRFPQDDVSNDAPFPNGICYFCMPSNCALYDATPVFPTYFTFVSTDHHGVHLYGHCLTFYELLDEDQRGKLGTILDSRWEAIPEGSRPPKPVLPPALYAPKVLCVLSMCPFLTQMRSYLMRLYQISLTPSPVPIERYISNFCLEVPMPPQGVTNVEYSMGDKSLIFTRPPANKPTSGQDIPFHTVLEALSVDNLILVVSAILCERQIIMHSTQLSLLTETAEVAKSLIYPFNWEIIYIPVLPEALVGVLEAPMSYFVGVQTSVYESLTNVPDSAVVVDLDNNDVSVTAGNPIHVIPPYVHDKLKRAVEQFEIVHEKRGDMWTATKLLQLDWAFKDRLPPGFDGEEEAYDASLLNWDDFREAFFRVYVKLLFNYQKYLYVKDVSKGADLSYKEPFNKAAFLESFKEGERPFMKDLLKSQAFNSFIDDRMSPDVGNDYDALFFDQSIDAKSNRSYFRRKTIDTPFLSDKGFDPTKSVVASSVYVGDLPEGVTYSESTFPRLNSSLFAPCRQHLIPKIEYGTLVKMRNRDKWISSDRVTTYQEEIYCAWFVAFLAGIHPSVKRPEPATRVRAGSLNTKTTAGEEGPSGDRDGAVVSGETSPGASTEEPDNAPRMERSGSMQEHLRNHNEREKKLSLAFDVLAFMRFNKLQTDEAIYRSLIECCGRVGDLNRATLILKDMYQAGIHPDSVVYSCLVNAFSADEGGGKNKLTIDWKGIMNTMEEEEKKQQEMKRIISVESATPKWMEGFKKAAKSWGSVTTASLASPVATSPAAPRPVSTPGGGKPKPSVDIDHILSKIEDAANASYNTLELLFPDCHIDVDRETCPRCKKKLTHKDIRDGWSTGSHDFTTECKYCTGVSALIPVGKDGIRGIARNFEVIQAQNKDNKNLIKKETFVPRFSVSAKCPEWEGSTGPKTLLFCEYLSPWVLRKEVQNRLKLFDKKNKSQNFGSEEFRKSSSTVYWNMVKYFKEFGLSVDFLLPPWETIALIMDARFALEERNDAAP